MQKNQIILHLESLGLTHKEALVYHYLNQVKKGTALSISKATGLKRPTVYLVLDSLINHNLVHVTQYRNVKDYRALTPSHLRRFIKTQQHFVDVHIADMQSSYDKRSDKLRLRVYSTKNSIKVLLEKSLREKAELKCLGSERLIAEQLGLYWQYYTKRSHQLGIPPTWKKTKGSIILLIWGDKVAFLELGEHVQLFGFKNKQLHDMYEDLWKNFSNNLA